MLEDSLQTFLPQFVDLSVTFAQTSLRIVLIVAAAAIAIRFVRLALGRFEIILNRSGQSPGAVPGASTMRIRTLMNVLLTIVVGMVWFLAVLTILGQVGINIGPILAGAGVVGLAVGFGAQNLVKDLVSGFFLLLENQIRVGDVAVINGTGGLVETITFRTIVLRDQAAVVHVFPNGAINTLANMTKDWSAYVIDIGVAYKEDTDRVAEIMRRVAEEMQSDPAYASRMLEPIEILGVDAFVESAVIIKARLKTLPLQQWAVGREYRRRLKKAFDSHGVEIPFPPRVTSPAFQLSLKQTDGT
jgi:small-conductance mechanosensitive channel